MPHSLFLSLFSFPQSVGPMPVRGIDHGGCRSPSALARFFFSFAPFFLSCGSSCHRTLDRLVLSHLGNWGQSWRHGENKKDRHTGFGWTKSERNVSQKR
jgi:hypothetical protein